MPHPPTATARATVPILKRAFMGSPGSDATLAVCSINTVSRGGLQGNGRAEEKKAAGVTDRGRAGRLRLRSSANCKAASGKNGRRGSGASELALEVVQGEQERGGPAVRAVVRAVGPAALGDQ